MFPAPERVLAGFHRAMVNWTRRGAGPRELPPVHAFAPGSVSGFDFNLHAVVLPPSPGPLGRARAVIYVEIHEPAGINHLFLSPERAQLMMAAIEPGLADTSLSWSQQAIDGVHFSRAECRAIQRVLIGALAQAKELAR